jgi:hypothetical protein
MVFPVIVRIRPLIEDELHEDGKARVIAARPFTVQLNSLNS